jgi:uncharacterized protein (DUF2252 family)
MDISRVKYNLNHNVRLVLERHYVDAEYMLTGCVIRKSNLGEFFYQAELTDKNSHSVVYASLKDVEEIKGSPTVGERKG